jgi:divalent metal cation (Fe/Co/Zn/Cd) transporter
MESTIIAAKLISSAILTLSGAVVLAGALNSHISPTNYWFGWMGISFFFLGYINLFSASRLGSTSRK